MANGTIQVEQEVYEKLLASGKMPETALELERALEGDLDQYQQETLAFCGVPYEFGGKTINPLTGLASLSALEAIDSPFLDPDVEDVDLTETAMTLYVIAGGKEVLQRVMGVKRRLRGAEKVERWAKKDPAMLKEYMEQVDRIRKEFAPLEVEALAFWETLEGVTLDDAVAFIFEVLKDAWGGMNMLPEKGGAGQIEKKFTTGMLKRFLRFVSGCFKRLVRRSTK